MPQPTRGARREGRLTLGLYNSYDRTRFTEAHRRALARAGAVAAAFDCNLVTFGFPYDRLIETLMREERDASGAAAGGGAAGGAGGEEAFVPSDLKDPRGVAAFVANSTTIGAGGRYFTDLAAAGRFHIEDLPGKGFPPQYGRPILATSRVPGTESLDAQTIAQDLAYGNSRLLVVGLGPHGFPRSLEKVVPERWDLTGRGMSLETCTAMSAGPAILQTHVQYLRERIREGQR